MQKVMVLARREAQRLKSDFIGTEHILLAILLPGDGVAMDILKKLCVDPKRIRIELEKILAPDPSPSVTIARPPLSPRSRRVIETSADSARQLGHADIGSGHLLMGLLGEGKGVAALVLTGLGLNERLVRETYLKLRPTP